MERSSGHQEDNPMLGYDVVAKRQDSHSSIARCKSAEVSLDTDVNGRSDAFNPVELFLAAVAACMIKGIERVAPQINFSFRGVEVRLHAVRQSSPPFISSITYDLIVDSDENDRRLELLHQNVRKCGTISNTVAAASKLEGAIVRSATSEAPAAS
jgi:uncharacterized OsmC-like protein